MTETKKLIEKLKKEIKKLEKDCGKCCYETKEGFVFPEEILPEKQAQLQFAKKLVKAIKKDINRIRFDIELNGWHYISNKDGEFVKAEELIKILDEVKVIVLIKK